MNDQDILHISPELLQIGAALASTVTNEPVELTDDQRAVLARATIADTSDAILWHKPRGIPKLQVDPIADRWGDELRAAFTDYAPVRKLIDEVSDVNPSNIIRAAKIVSQDDRLTADEREQIVSGLRKHRRQSSADSSVASRATASNRAYLSSISVEGFRGIGPHANLPLEPQPGLTLVYGANGSGKSSFVEALDVLLAGTTARFDLRGPEWQSAWHNVHSPASGSVEGVFVGSKAAGGEITLRRSWKISRSLPSTNERRAYDHTPDEQIKSLGWKEALVSSKPILGYGELGPLFEEGQTPGRTTTETTLARHIRLRAGIADSLTEGLADQAGTASLRGSGIRGLVQYWSALTYGLRRGHESWLGDFFSDHRRSAGMPVLPRHLPWRELALAVTQRRGSALSLRERVQLRQLLDIAQVYLSSMAPETREAIEEANTVLHDPDHPRYSGFSKRGSARVALYCQSLVEAIHQSRLDQFSRSVEANWSTIRGKDSTVRFNKPDSSGA